MTASDGTKRRLALFDFDGTMIKGDSIAALFRLMLRRGILSPWQGLGVLGATALWRMGLLRVERLKQMTLAPLGQFTYSQRDGMLKRFVHEDLAPRIYPEAMDALRRHSAEGFLILVVSASPAIYLKHLADILPADALIGTETDNDFAIARNMTGETKAQAVMKWLQQNHIEPDWAGSFAYGDSRSDLPMLRLVGNPFLVNAKPAATKAGEGIPRLNWD